MKRQRRRNRKLDEALVTFALMVPPHPAEAIETTFALGKALTHGKAIQTVLENDPVLIDIWEAVTKTLRYAIFFAARLPDDPRGFELAKWCGCIMDRMSTLALVKLQRLADEQS
jgi:hypothetical protein